ncbi:craniofacial development protein 2-like [Penaeus vannamei]|uniref:craniofacial development protein 2-like n=1 Tax=Penaeus vannamei TaxID=6689 RepID=UPI00387F387B
MRVRSLNVGMVTGKGRTLVDMMERRNLDVLCVQETKWQGYKARLIGGGFKLFYHSVDGRKIGVGVVVKEKYIKKCIGVISLKMENERVLLNVIKAYALQVGGELEDKEEFCGEVEDLVQSIAREERVVIGANLNGHVGEGNSDHEGVASSYGVGEGNAEGQMIVDFAKRIELAIVTTYFKKEEHRITYRSRGRSSQIEYIFCRRRSLKEFSNCRCEYMQIKNNLPHTSQKLSFPYVGCGASVCDFQTEESPFLCIVYVGVVEV